MSRGEYQRNTSILETYSEGWEKATLGLAGKLKPLQRHGRDDLSGCSLKAQQILSGGITLTNSLDLQSRTSRMWKLFIMDYWTLLRMVSLVHLEFFLTLPPSTETSRYISSLLAWESLNWHLSSSLSGGFWAHRMVTPIQGWSFGLFHILSLKIRASLLGSQHSWCTPLPATYPCEISSSSSLRIHLVYLLINSVAS